MGTAETHKKYASAEPKTLTRVGRSKTNFMLTKQDGITLEKVAAPVAARFTINGWAYIDGHWVYLPLWDPAPEKKFRGFKNFHAAQAVLSVANLITSKAFAEKARGIAKELAGSVSQNLIADWDGDGICPPNWPPVFPPRGPKIPEQLFFDDELPAFLKNGIAGFLLTRVGELAGNRSISEFGKQVMNERG